MTVPAPISYDESARKVSIAKDASLTPEYKKELQIELDKLNSFAKEMVACPGSIPPPPNEANRNLAIQVAKLRDSGAMQFKAGKPQEALTQINMALDMALKRPLYEATGAAIADVSEVLAYRCDINMVLGNWAAAYADAELLCLIKPQIPRTTSERVSVCRQPQSTWRPNRHTKAVSCTPPRTKFCWVPSLRSRQCWPKPAHGKMVVI